MHLQSVATEWASLIFRWLHVVAAMGWIGSSFYFIALDLSLKPGEGLPNGVKGEAWQVHGGGFYRIIKFMVAPKAMPDELTWFKWEAYTTWLTGIGTGPPPFASVESKLSPVLARRPSYSTSRR